MKKKLTLSKKELIKLWNKQCENVSIDSVLEKQGEMFSIKINDDLSLVIINGEIKIVFGYVEYISEPVSKKEYNDLLQSFAKAEETIQRLQIDKFTSSGINAL